MDPQSEKGKIPLYMMPTPTPRSVEEIALCCYIERLQQARQFAYNSCEERVAKRLEFKIANLILFLRER